MQSELSIKTVPFQLPKPSGTYRKNLVKKVREALTNIDLSDGEV